MTIDEYILNHIDPEGDYLYRLYRATNIHLLHGRMASGHLQGRVLKMLVQMIQPKYILEVGTFSGYSAICMAEGLEHTPPLTASLISTIEPILNPILAAVVIGEELGTTALVGAAIVVVGIIAYNVLKARFPTEPESMENPV